MSTHPTAALVALTGVRGWRRRAARARWEAALAGQCPQRTHHVAAVLAAALDGTVVCEEDLVPAFVTWVSLGAELTPVPGSVPSDYRIDDWRLAAWISCATRYGIAALAQALRVIAYLREPGEERAGPVAGLVVTWSLLIEKVSPNAPAETLWYAVPSGEDERRLLLDPTLPWLDPGSSHRPAWVVAQRGLAARLARALHRLGVEGAWFLAVPDPEVLDTVEHLLVDNRRPLPSGTPFDVALSDLTSAVAAACETR